MRKVCRSVTNIQFITDLEKKAFEHKILLYSNKKDQRTQQCHNKSFIITRLFSPRESFDCGLPGTRWNIDGKRNYLL